uniref:Uncharacterized protein n=1 Tax=Molossus molossus TaxID=27622 RepID=A0A7J8JWU4_MOLMO|nr:hypothetical protein HJG59_007878 [Molossus molossus]
MLHLKTLELYPDLLNQKLWECSPCSVCDNGPSGCAQHMMKFENHWTRRTRGYKEVSAHSQCIKGKKLHFQGRALWPPQCCFLKLCFRTPWSPSFLPPVFIKKAIQNVFFMCIHKHIAMSRHY